MNYSNTILELYGVLIIAVILISSLTSRNDDSGIHKIFEQILFVQILRLLSDIGFAHSAHGNNQVLYIIFGIVNYISFYAIISLITRYFVFFLHPQKPLVKLCTRMIYAVCFIGCVLWIISLFNGMFVEIGPGGVTIQKPLYILGQAPGWIAMILDFVIVLTSTRELGSRNVFCFLSYLILPMMGTLFRQFWFYDSFQSMAITLSCLLIYTNIHVDQQNLLREKEKQLAEERIRIMLSQIQPHFMYNTLNTIYYLADKHPDTAQRAISEFSDYLRGNIDALTASEPIPFEKELSHIRHYLSLEEIRFAEELRTVYDIEVREFRVPALSIQPLVENAVKHGIGRKPDGGTVWIKTKDTGNNIVIQVIDNGVGFKDSPDAKQSTHTHVGIQNVRERISSMMNGTLNIKSTPGQGTVAEVILPKTERY